MYSFDSICPEAPEASGESGREQVLRSGVSARELERDDGTGSAEANPWGSSSPVTDGSVSCTEYAQPEAELSRCPPGGVPDSPNRNGAGRVFDMRKARWILDETELRAFLRDDYDRVVNAVAFGSLGYADAEEAVQEALVRAWIYSSAGNRIERLDAWVTVTAWNRARTVLRRLARERRAKQLLADARPEVPADPSDDAIDLFGALARLPRRLRQVSVLRYWLGLSTAETAQALGIAEGTVKRALSDARTALAAALSLSEEGVTDAHDR
jgi:RNA polymerase sigma factor (sigma-70 family)